MQNFTPLKEGQVRQWLGDPDEEPAYVKQFKVVGKRNAAKSATADSLKSGAHSLVVLAFALATYFLHLSPERLLVASGVWVGLMSVRFLWNMRRWLLAIRAEKAFVEEVEKDVKVLPEDEPKAATG